MRLLSLILSYLFMFPNAVIAETSKEVRLRCQERDKLEVLAKKGIISKRLCMQFKDDQLRVYLRGLIFDLAKYKHAKATDLQNATTGITDKKTAEEALKYDKQKIQKRREAFENMKEIKRFSQFLENFLIIRDETIKAGGDIDENKNITFSAHGYADGVVYNANDFDEEILANLPSVEQQGKIYGSGKSYSMDQIQTAISGSDTTENRSIRSPLRNYYLARERAKNILETFLDELKKEGSKIQEVIPSYDADKGDFANLYAVSTGNNSHKIENFKGNCTGYCTPRRGALLNVHAPDFTLYRPIKEESQSDIHPIFNSPSSVMQKHMNSHAVITLIKEVEDFVNGVSRINSFPLATEEEKKGKVTKLRDGMKSFLTAIPLYAISDNPDDHTADLDVGNDFSTHFAEVNDELYENILKETTYNKKHLNLVHNADKADNDFSELDKVLYKDPAIKNRDINKNGITKFLDKAAKMYQDYLYATHEFMRSKTSGNFSEEDFFVQFFKYKFNLSDKKELERYYPLISWARIFFWNNISAVNPDGSLIRLIPKEKTGIKSTSGSPQVALPFSAFYRPKERAFKNFMMHVLNNYFNALKVNRALQIYTTGDVIAKFKTTFNKLIQGRKTAQSGVERLKKQSSTLRDIEFLSNTGSATSFKGLSNLNHFVTKGLAESIFTDYNYNTQRFMDEEQKLFQRYFEPSEFVSYLKGSGNSGRGGSNRMLRVKAGQYQKAPVTIFSQNVSAETSTKNYWVTSFAYQKSVTLNVKNTSHVNKLDLDGNPQSNLSPKSSVTNILKHLIGRDQFLHKIYKYEQNSPYTNSDGTFLETNNQKGTILPAIKRVTGGSASTILSFLNFKEAFADMLNFASGNIKENNLVNTSKQMIDMMAKPVRSDANLVYYTPNLLKTKTSDKGVPISGFLHTACKTGVTFRYDNETTEFMYQTRFRTPKGTYDSTKTANSKEIGPYVTSYKLPQRAESSFINKDNYKINIFNPLNMIQIKRPTSYLIGNCKDCGCLKKGITGNELEWMLTNQSDKTKPYRYKLLDFSQGYNWEKDYPYKEYKIESNPGDLCMFSPIVPQSHDVGSGGTKDNKDNINVEKQNELVYSCPIIDALEYKGVDKNGYTLPDVIKSEATIDAIVDECIKNNDVFPLKEDEYDKHCYSNKNDVCDLFSDADINQLGISSRSACIQGKGADFPLPGNMCSIINNLDSPFMKSRIELILKD